MQQSLIDRGSLQADVEAWIEQCRTTLKKIDQALLAQATALGWAAPVRRCQGIPGVGPLTALAMVATYQCAPFHHDDAFIALGRKIARRCFVLLKKEVDFDPSLRSGGCIAT